MRSAMVILGVSAICLSAYAQAAGGKQPAPKEEERVTLDCSWPESPESSQYTNKRGYQSSHKINAWRQSIEICRQASCGSWQVEQNKFRQRQPQDDGGYWTTVIDRNTSVITQTLVQIDQNGKEVPVSVQGTCRRAERQF